MAKPSKSMPPNSSAWAAGLAGFLDAFVLRYIMGRMRGHLDAQAVQLDACDAELAALLDMPIAPVQQLQHRCAGAYTAA